MSTEFNGKKLLVIGGTSGMGLQTARMVLEQGGSVVIVGHREDKAEEARKALSSLGTVTALTADLSRAEDVKRLLHTIDEHHKDINLLVNAAGVFFPKAFLEHTESDYEQYLTLNKAFFFITQKVVANLVASERPGAIVNIGSMWGKQAIAATPSSAYSMAKAGLHSLTQHLAMGWHPNKSGSMPFLRRLSKRRFTRDSYPRPRFMAPYRDSTASTQSAGLGRHKTSPRSSSSCCRTRQHG